MIIDGTLDLVKQLFFYWNNLVPGLGFTYEAVQLQAGESFSFLDLQISLDFPPLYSIQFCTYQKSLNQYLYIHQASLHPPSVKSSVVKTELIRYLRTNSTSKGYKLIKTQFWQRLRARGYSALWLGKIFRDFPYDDRHKYLQFRSSSSSKKILIFKIRYTLEMIQLRLGARLAYLIDDKIRRELNFGPTDRIITCYLRCPNSRELLLRNRDDRLPEEINE